MLKIRETIKPKIGFVGLDRQNTLDDLNFAIKNGFDCYEIQGIGEKFDFESKIIKQIKKISEENNVSLGLHAMQSLWPIASLIPELSYGVVKFMKKEIILAHKIGAQRITVHGGEKDKLKRKDSAAKNFKVLIKNLKEIVNFGRKYKIKIGLENSFASNKLCRTPKDLLRVASSVKGLGITLDVGHANIVNFNLLEYFKKIKNLIINIHLHDNNGKFDEHALIGKGNINFKRFLRECKKSNYFGPFILEIFPRKNALKGKKILLKLWNQV
ncbi:MAG TPA: sugar phosphate isomerase/epimerase [Candidatus Humimicrobiaceae bacterium]|nr:sugar phosphate isomerase/epimerase [Candidatus Humimicrobiaceae bacterium]